MTLTHLNPSGLHTNPAFSQGVRISGPGDLLVVGGQNGTGADGALVSTECGEQSRQALRNVLTVLDEVGASQADVARLTVYLVAGQELGPVFAAAQETWGRHATALSVIQVAGLARPDALVEVEALAQIPAS